LKISPQSPKTDFGLQNQYGRVIYLSIGNFIKSKKKYTFGGQRSENKLSEPKNVSWARKSVRSIDRKFDMDQAKINF
jgi:hypothetical protein